MRAWWPLLHTGRPLCDRVPLLLVSHGYCARDLLFRRRNTNYVLWSVRTPSIRAQFVRSSSILVVTTKDSESLQHPL